MKNKKGFTLAEILGVIVIVGMLMILVTPGIINKLRSNRDNVEAAGNEIIYSAANQYISENKKTYKEGKQYCISIQKLVADGKLVSPVINVVTGENVEEKYVLAQIQKSGSMNFYITDKDSCEESTLLPLIQFSLSPTLKEKTWSTKRTVTIIYPANGEEHKYAITSSENEPAENDWQNVESLSNNKTTVDFTESGYIHAKMKYENGSETKSRMPVGNIDVATPEIESTCTTTKATIKITDMPEERNKRSGIKKYQILEDGVVKKTQEINPARIDTVTTNYTITNNKIYSVKTIDAAGNEAESILCLENPVKVTFDPNGGTVSPTLKIYDGGKKYSETPGGEFPTPTRTGYSHNGWYTAATGGTQVTQTTKVPNNDHTLHAQWTANTYKVQFLKNATDATGSMSDESFTYGTEKALTANAYTWTGHAFNGWNKKSDGSSTSYTNGQKVKNLTSTKDGVVKLHAQWIKKTIKVTFMRNTSSTDKTSATQNFTYGVKDQKFSEKGWSKTGHTLLGWSKDKNAADKTWNVTSGVSDAWINSNYPSITIYGIWKANTYKVQFVKNATDATGTMSDESFTYGKEKALTANAYKRSGYSFAGWNTKSDGSGTSYIDGQKVKNLTSTNNGTVKLYARWTLTCETRVENGKKVTGWKKIGSYWYYYDSNGCMVKGWVTDPNSTSCSSKKYYTNISGQMQVGWQKIGSYWYYFDSSGCMLTGWIYVSSSTSCPSRYYYTNSSGQMQIGWLKYNNKWYYLAKANSTEAKWQTNTSKKPTGCMLTGWVYSTDYTCNSHGWYFNSSGALVKSTTIDNMYKVDSSGCWTHTWNSCVSGGYYQGGYVWSDTGGAWHDGWCEAGSTYTYYTTYNLCSQNCSGACSYTDTGGYSGSGAKNYVCSTWDSCATWHPGYYEGGNVWSDYATWVPCTGGWVAA